MITICNHDDISGVTPEEYFEYHCQDENAKQAYENSIEDSNKLKVELEELGGELEEVSEQLHFATLLIDMIENELVCATRLNEFRKKFRQLVEESSLER